MIDLYFFEIDVTTFVVISTIITLLLQLFICFKAKKILIRLLPVALLTTSVVIFSICSACFNDWNSVSALLSALLSFALLVGCGIGWGIWAIVRKKVNK